MFYRKENNNLVSGKRIIAKDVDLKADLHDTYTYPVAGFYWFDTEKEARVFFGLEFDPTSISMRQCRLMLLQAGLLATVEGIVAGLSDAAKIEWEYASVVRRDNPLVNQVATAAGMTQAQVDQMFADAAAL